MVWISPPGAATTGELLLDPQTRPLKFTYESYDGGFLIEIIPANPYPFAAASRVSLQFDQLRMIRDKQLARLLEPAVSSHVNQVDTFG